MKIYPHRIFAGLLVSMLVLVSCPSPTNQQDPIPQIDDEMSYNYVLLRYFYLNGRDELRSYSGYKGRGKDKPYGDVLAMYADLSDPWTNYWTPDEAQYVWAQLITSDTTQKLMGMNLRVEPIPDANEPDCLYVDRVWIGCPADISGQIKANDQIIAVNDVDLLGLPVLKGNTLLAKYQEAALDDTVSLTIRRGGIDIPLEPITKAVMLLPTVYLDYIDEIPVIQITQFSTESGYDENAANKRSSTSKELYAVLTRVKSGNPPVGIIDLRGNPGGSVDQCFASIEEFVAGGIVIRYEDHHQNGSKPVVDRTGVRAVPGDPGEDIRWIVLADANSASAAEILLYALKNSRSETHIIGETTYGKAVGQRYMETFERGVAGITSMKFFDENWNTYHGVGIAPDEPVASAGALEAAITYALSMGAQSRSVLAGSAPRVDRAAIGALNERLITRRVPANGISGGAWKLQPAEGVR